VAGCERDTPLPIAHNPPLNGEGSGLAYRDRVTRDPVPADYPGCPVTVTQVVAEGLELRPPRWGLFDVVWSLIAAVVIGLAVGSALFALDAPVGVQILVGVVSPWIALAGWPLFVTAWRGNGPRIDLGLSLTWSDTGWGALAGISGLLLAGVAALITRLFVPDLNSTAGEVAGQLEDTSSRLSLTIFAAIVMVGAPIVEELFFRGLFFAALRKRGVNAVLTIIITGVVFAGFHFEPTRFFVLLPTGLLLGWVRWKTGSTGSSMVAHGLVNAPGAILLLVGVPGVTT
jgi:membrane protease YdiL (CAAX protease family)